MDKYKVLKGKWWCAGDGKAVRKTVKLLLRGKDCWKEGSEDAVGEPWEYRSQELLRICALGHHC